MMLLSRAALTRAARDRATAPLSIPGEWALCVPRKRFLFAAIVFAAPVCLVSAQDEDAKVSVDMIGIGGMSCAHWRATKEHLLEGTVWIYGFWTDSITLLRRVVNHRPKLIFRR